MLNFHTKKSKVIFLIHTFFSCSECSYKTEFLPGKPLQLQSSDNTFPLKQFHTCQKLLHNAISSKEAEQEVT